MVRGGGGADLTATSAGWAVGSLPVPNYHYYLLGGWGHVLRMLPLVPAWRVGSRTAPLG